jgi:hypothetical protein
VQVWSPCFSALADSIVGDPKDKTALHQNAHLPYAHFLSWSLFYAHYLFVMALL